MKGNRANHDAVWTSENRSLENEAMTATHAITGTQARSAADPLWR
jgi:hypothetical protein